MDNAWKAEHARLVDEISALKDEKDEYMQRGVQFIELMQHAEIIFKNATAEKKRKNGRTRLIEPDVEGWIS